MTKLHLDDDFINKINQKYSRPFIQINAASSMDGKIAGLNGTRLEISPKEDFERVHELRSSLDSILVGIDTIINDDPRLMVKELFTDNRPLKHPTRLILDSKGRIDSGKRLFNSSTPTIIITSFDALNNLRDRFRSKGNVEIQGVHSNKSGLLDYQKGICYMLAMGKICYSGRQYCQSSRDGPATNSHPPANEYTHPYHSTSCNW